MSRRPLWDWDGPFGGLPPFDSATPEAIERDYHAASVLHSKALKTIAEDLRQPTFDNTITPLEAAGQPLDRVIRLFRIVSSTASSPAMRELDARLAPLVAALDGKLAGDPVLMARVDAVADDPNVADLEPDQRRLLAKLRSRFARHGARLGPTERQRLAELNAEIAIASSRFVRNVAAEEGVQYTLFEDETDLVGLDAGWRANAASLAVEKGCSGGWVVANVRQAVMPFLAKASNRSSRQRVWQLWTARGENAGEFDNRPLMARILKRRGEMARLLGFSNFAAMQTAQRMAGSPEAALDLLFNAWGKVRISTEAHFERLQSLAEADGQVAPIAPWDYYYYAEKDRQSRLGLDASIVQEYLTLDGVIAAVLDAASRLHDLDFTPLEGAAVLAPTIRPYGVYRCGEPIGVVYIDVVARDEKRRGSWQVEARTASTFEGKVLPISVVVTSVDASGSGGQTLMNWESANVIFHEFGHALHVLLSAARYPSLGSAMVAWDMVELPALLNERWLGDRDLLRRHMRHVTTGEPMPDDLIEKIEAGLRHDRVFSVNPNFLAGAVADLRIYGAADGSEVDAVAIEKAVRDELGLPAGVDLILRMPHFFHVFGTIEYAAGVYSYLWADVMAAEAAEYFLCAPGGLFDGNASAHWRRSLLSVGDSVPAGEAYRHFLGHDPDVGALMRRFDLVQTP